MSSTILMLILNMIVADIDGQTCGPRIEPRNLRFKQDFDSSDNEIVKFLPCNIAIDGFCNQPGDRYPWNSLKQFIIDNQGFIRRMYGDQRQSQIIDQELKRLNNRYDNYNDDNKRKQRKNFVFDEPMPSSKVSKDEPIPSSKVSKDEPITSSKVFKDDSMVDISNISADDDESLTFTTSSSSLIESKTIIINNGDNNNQTTSETIEKTITTATITNIDNNFDDFDEDNDFIDDENTLVETQTTTSATISTDTTDPIEPDHTVKGYNACPIKQEVVAPYWANNTRGEILALLNVYPFEQYIQWEKCTNEYEQMHCRHGCRCEQQYRLHRLLAFDPKNECRGIFADWFRFPGCCVCICYDYNNNNSMDFHDNLVDSIHDFEDNRKQSPPQHERINNRKARL